MQMEIDIKERSTDWAATEGANISGETGKLWQVCSKMEFYSVTDLYIFIIGRMIF